MNWYELRWPIKDQQGQRDKKTERRKGRETKIQKTNWEKIWIWVRPSPMNYSDRKRGYGEEGGGGRSVDLLSSMIYWPRCSVFKMNVWTSVLYSSSDDLVIYLFELFFAHFNLLFTVFRLSSCLCNRMVFLPKFDLLNVIIHPKTCWWWDYDHMVSHSLGSLN